MQGLVTLLVAANGCAPELPPPDPAEHREELLSWQADRMEELKQPDGWLSVVGLFWLEEGISTFGSDSGNALVFPAKAPPHIGTFIRDGNAIRMEVEPGAVVMHEGEPVTSIMLYSDAYDETTVVSLGSFQWFVLERQDLLGIRLKDTANAAIREFSAIETFPISPEWILPARFDRYDPPRVIEVPNILGTVSEQPSPGAVVFRVGGQTFRLDVTGDPAADRFFITFGDQTNGSETYGGGRFLSVDAPDERGRTFIDFNKAYNPPCVFTAFATCPLPPPQNRLHVRVEAGEKMYHGAAHE
jgi:uncharacterized protein (DUF1684 family)